MTFFHLPNHLCGRPRAVVVDLVRPGQPVGERGKKGAHLLRWCGDEGVSAVYIRQVVSNPQPTPFGHARGPHLCPRIVLPHACAVGMSSRRPQCHRGTRAARAVLGGWWIWLASWTPSFRAAHEPPPAFVPWRSLEGARGSRRCNPIARRSRAGHVSGPEIACVWYVDRLGRWWVDASA